MAICSTRSPSTNAIHALACGTFLDFTVGCETLRTRSTCWCRDCVGLATVLSALAPQTHTIFPLSLAFSSCARFDLSICCWTLLTTSACWRSDRIGLLAVRPTRTPISSAMDTLLSVALPLTASLGRTLCSATTCCSCNHVRLMAVCSTLAPRAFAVDPLIRFARPSSTGLGLSVLIWTRRSTGTRTCFDLVRLLAVCRTLSPITNTVDAVLSCASFGGLVCCGAL